MIMKRGYVLFVGWVMGVCMFVWGMGCGSVWALSVPDAQGVYSGTASATLTGCQDPADNTTLPGNVTNTISSQTGASLSGSFLLTVSFPGVSIVQTAPFTGTVGPDGSVNGSFTYTTTVNGGFDSSGIGTFSGTLAGNTITGLGTTQDTVGDTCQAAVSLTATRSGPIPSPIVVPITNSYDLNGDGTADFVWRNNITGQVAVWLLSGPTLISSGIAAAVGLEWQIAGLGDVDGDGKSDIVWRHTTSGGVFVWLMNGVSIASSGSPGDVPLDWIIDQVSDTNGDGKSDIGWRNTTTGDTAVWLMNGTTIASFGFPGGAGPEWEIQP